MYSRQDDGERYGAQDMRYARNMRAATAEREMDKRYLQQNHNRTPNGRNNHADTNQQILNDSPMSAASEWPEEDPMPFPYERKRNGTPSLLEDFSAKRHQAFYQGDEVPPTGLSRDPRQARVAVHGIDLEDSPLNRKLDPSFWESKHPSNQERFLGNIREKTRYVRAQTQEPQHQYLTPSRKPSQAAQHRTPITLPRRQHQDTSQQSAGQERRKEQWGYHAERRSESRPHMRFSSAAPEVFRDQMDREPAPEQQFRQYPVQAAQLGSPIWADQRQHPQYAITIAGNYMPTKAGNGGQLPHPQSGQSGYHELDPRTPDNQRSRGRSVAPHTPASNSGRSSSRRTRVDYGPRSRSRSIAPPQPNSVNRRERSKSVYHTPLPAAPLAIRTPQLTPRSNQQAYAESLSDTESPMMEDLFKKGRRSRMAQNTVKFEASPSDIRQELPQNNIFSSNIRRPRAPMVQTPRPNPTRHSEREVIDLISPETSYRMRPPPTPVRSIPMKERIAPAKRPSNGTKASLSKPKITVQSKQKPKPERTLKVETSPQDIRSAEYERQKKLAEQILKREEEAVQLEVWGEVLPEDSETKKKREEQERAANQRKREEAEAEKQMKQEEKRLAELEKARLREEAAEQARNARDVEEARNKVRRDAERENREAAEAQLTERLRQQAEERIKAEREKKAAEDAEREREKQKATSIQVQAEEMAKIKAKQEEAKKQAASLSLSKLASVGDPARFAASHLADNSDVASTENPLFVRDDPPNFTKPNDDPSQGSALPKAYANQSNIYAIDERAAKKPTGPTTAAEAMKFHQNREGTSNYRAEREAFEVKMMIERTNKANARLVQRWERAKSTQPEPSPQKTLKAPPPPTRPSSTLNPNTNRNPSTNKPTTTALNQLAKPAASSAIYPIGGRSTKPPNPNFRKHNGPSSVGSSSASASRNIPNLLTESEHQNLLQEKAAKEKEKKATLNAVKRQQARQQATVNAREKKRQELINEAKENGRELCEADLNTEIEAFMARRQELIDKRAATKANKEKMKAMHPSFASFQETANALDDPPEGQPKKIAARKTCNDFEDDERGRGFVERLRLTPDYSDDDDPREYDQDDEIIERDATEDESEGVSDEESEVSEEDPDSDDEPPEKQKPHNPDESNLEGLDSQLVKSLAATGIRSPAIEKTSHTQIEPAEPIDPSPETEPETINVYSVVRHDTKNGVQQKAKIMQTFTDRQEANTHIRGVLKKYQSKVPWRFREVHDEDGMYSGDLDWDRNARHSVMLYIRKQSMTVSAAPHFDPKKSRRFPAKSWFIKRIVTERIVHKSKEPNALVDSSLWTKEKVLQNFSDLFLANTRACELFLEFVKPRKATFANLAIWQNLILPELKRERDEANEKKVPFFVSMEPGDDKQMPWLMERFKEVIFEVDEFRMEGPLN